MTDTFVWAPDNKPQGKASPNVLKAVFGEGYAQRFSNSITAIPRKWSCTFSNKAQVPQIEEFLTNKGSHEAFYWITPGSEFSVVLETIGTCDGYRYTWQLGRTIGGVYKNCFSHTGTPVVYLSDWFGGYRTNYVLYSEDLSNAAWTLQSGATVSTYKIVAPDSTVSAYALTSGGATSFIWQNFVAPVTDYYTVSCDIYAGTSSCVYLKIRNQTTSTYIACAQINPQTGLYESGGTGNLTVVSLGGGWYRISAITPAQVTSGDTLRVMLYPGSNSGETVYAWGFDCKPIGSWSSYIKTTSAPVTVYDGVGGILYSTSRTNLLTYSQDFSNAAWLKINSGTTSPNVVANTVTAPDGTVTADEVTFGAIDASTDYSILRQSVTFVGGAGAGSIWVKAKETAGVGKVLVFSFNDGAQKNAVQVTLTSAWQRVNTSQVSTLSAGTVHYQIFSSGTINGGPNNLQDAVVVHLWGAQFETGATVTSYIPTTSAAVSLTDYALSSSGAVTLASKTIPVTRQNLGVGNGSQVTWTISSPSAPTVQNVWRSDWQGYQKMYSTSRTNLMVRSQEFDNASWFKNNCTATADAVAAPDGTTTADKLIETSATGYHYTKQSPTLPIGYSNVSLYVKAGERSACSLVLNNGTNYALATFNIATGAVYTSYGTASNITAGIVSLGSGWYRIWLAASFAASGFGECALRICNGSFQESYTGDGTSGLYIWGMQVETGSVATSYIPTTTVAVSVTDYSTAGYNVTFSTAPLLNALLYCDYTYQGAPPDSSILTASFSGNDTKLCVCRSWNTSNSDYDVMSISAEFEEVVQ